MGSIGKWCKNGVIVGIILTLFITIKDSGLGGIFADFGEFMGQMIMTAAICGAFGIALRKWVFKTFWQ